MSMNTEPRDPAHGEHPTEREGFARRILLVEDDEKLLSTLTRDLEHAEFRVISAPSGMRALPIHQSSPFDLILLDLDVCARDGLQVLKTLKPQDGVPVIVITANLEPSSRTQSFDLGADDFLKKPISSKELIARIKAILKRTIRFRLPVRLRSGPFLLDREVGTIFRDGKPVKLTPIEYRIIESIFTNPGQYLSQAEILMRAWPPDARPSSYRTVGVHMVSLRRKLAQDGDQAWIIFSGSHGFGWTGKIQEDR